MTSRVEGLGMLVGDTAHVVATTAPIDEVSRLLVEFRIPAVCIVEQGVLLGVVTRTDVLAARAGTTAGEAMSTYVLALPASAAIGRAAAMMAVERVGHVVVVGDDGGLVGLVSAVDIARHYAVIAGFRV